MASNTNEGSVTMEERMLALEDEVKRLRAENKELRTESDSEDDQESGAGQFLKPLKASNKLFLEPATFVGLQRRMRMPRDAVGALGQPYLLTPVEHDKYRSLEHARVTKREELGMVFQALYSLETWLEPITQAWGQVADDEQDRSTELERIIAELDSEWKIPALDDGATTAQTTAHKARVEKRGKLLEALQKTVQDCKDDGELAHRAENSTSVCLDMAAYFCAISEFQIMPDANPFLRESVRVATSQAAQGFSTYSRSVASATNNFNKAYRKEAAKVVAKAAAAAEHNHKQNKNRKPPKRKDVKTKEDGN